MMPKIQIATQSDLPEIVALLQNNGLPTQDIQGDKQVFFTLKKADEIIGSVAYEAYGLQAILRSLAVKQMYQSNGYGLLLTEFLLDCLRKNAFQHIYLLTNTAERFFQRFQFQYCERSTVHQTILESEEFKHLCPSNSVCMHLPLI